MSHPKAIKFQTWNFQALMKSMFDVLNIDVVVSILSTSKMAIEFFVYLEVPCMPLCIEHNIIQMFILLNLGQEKLVIIVL